jgi:hypothetical protein
MAGQPSGWILATTANGEPAICNTHSRMICARMQAGKTRQSRLTIRRSIGVSV